MLKAILMLSRVRVAVRRTVAAGLALGAAVVCPAAAMGVQSASDKELRADVNRDGTADVLRIEVGFDAESPRTGRISAVSDADGEQLYVVVGESANDWFGFAVSVADLDGDGASELIVSAPGLPIGTGAGRLYLLSGQSGQVLATISAGDGRRIGLDIQVLADQDGDGWREIVVEGGIGGPEWEGRSFIYIYSGRTGALLANRAMASGSIRRFVEGGGRVFVAEDLEAARWTAPTWCGWLRS